MKEKIVHVGGLESKDIVIYCVHSWGSLKLGFFDWFIRGPKETYRVCEICNTRWFPLRWNEPTVRIGVSK